MPNWLEAARLALADGRFREAEDLARHALDAQGRPPEALVVLGMAACATGDVPAGVDFIERALAVGGEDADVLAALGAARLAADRTAEAETALRRALELEPAHGPAAMNLGELYQHTGRCAEAEAVLQPAARANPQMPGLWTSLGDAQQSLGRLGEAVRSYEVAIAAEAGAHAAWYGKGCAEMALGEAATAAGSFRRVLDLAPGHLPASHNLAKALLTLGRVDEAVDRWHALAEAGVQRSAMALAVSIPGAPSADAEAVRDARRAIGRSLVGRPAASTAPGPRRPGPLRVGYLSAFFHRPNYMKPVWGLIRHHDRSAVAVHLLADGQADPSAWNGYRRDDRDAVLDLRDLDNADAARRIAELDLDVLVDLNGYSCTQRLELLARKPARRMVGWFNWYAPAGLETFDGLVGDAVVVPPGEEGRYDAPVERLEGTYLAFEVHYATPPPRPRRTGRELVFGCLAPLYKITPDVLAAWARILARSPEARLLLRSRALAAESNRDHLAASFAAKGGDPRRLVLLGPAEHGEFLETYDRIDVVLDTFPYNGGTTTTEAIWQGAPVAAFCGDRWASRTSASILRAAGWGAWVAEDLAGYVDLAVRLGQQARAEPDTPGRREARRRAVQASAACDAAGLAGQMEALYRRLAGPPVSRPAPRERR